MKLLIGHVIALLLAAGNIGAALAQSDRLMDLYSQYRHHLEEEDLELAAEFATATLERSREEFPAGDSVLADRITDLADVLALVNRGDEARSLYIEAVSIFEASPDEDRSRLGQTLLSLARLNASRDEREEGLTNFARALDVYEETLGPDHPALVNVLVPYADFETRVASREAREGDPDAAAMHLGHGRGIIERLGDDPNRELLMLRCINIHRTLAITFMEREDRDRTSAHFAAYARTLGPRGEWAPFLYEQGSEHQHPMQALEMNIEGEVELLLTIDADGRVVTSEVIDSSPTGIFDRAARVGVRDWRYIPKIVNGVAVESSELRHRATFSLEGVPGIR